MSNAIHRVCASETQVALNQDSRELEEMTLLTNSESLLKLKEEIGGEFSSLNERQQNVRSLHDCIQTIHAAIDSDGIITFENHPEVAETLKRLEELSVKVNGYDKKVYSRDDIQRTLESTRNLISDLNTQNDLQMQKITNLMNRQNECYQMARAILRTLHEDKINKTRSIQGR